MRASVVMIVALIGLAGCGAPAVPESGAGFTDYNTYLKENAQIDPQAAVAAPIVPPGFSTDAAAAAIDAAEGGQYAAADTGQFAAPIVDSGAPLDARVIGQDPAPGTEMPAVRPRGDAPAGIQSESGEVAGAVGAVSDEQDFEAVKSRETIESDKARIEANRAQYVVVQPSELPVRPGDTGPNIVEFALATNNAPGVQLYDRSSISFTKPEVACAKYTSSDQAQQAFLATGGPENDRKGLDQDGDGFACLWDPRPFRNALK